MCYGLYVYTTISKAYLVEQVMKLLVWLASLSVSRSDADENPESAIDVDRIDWSVVSDNVVVSVNVVDILETNQIKLSLVKAIEQHAASYFQVCIELAHPLFHVTAQNDPQSLLMPDPQKVPML